jgi:hypothetical protein
MPDRCAHRAVDQGQHGDAASGLTLFFKTAFFQNSGRLRDGDLVMKTPVVWVTAALAAAIVLTASFLIATGTRGGHTPPVSTITIYGR